ncbi:MAG: hypothetical protein RLZZ591_1565 [Pseudomonadota bacterium]|jgi:outer membrane protein TolC
MRRALSFSFAQRACCAAMVAVLSGCASVSPEQNISRVNDELGGFTPGQLTLARSAQAREQRAQAAAALLAMPVEQKEAVQLALVNSPALQALLAQGWAQSADAAQGGRIANPVFSFERMVAGDELELGRALSFGLLDVLTLPARQAIAERRIEQAQLRLTSEVVDHITQVRQAWVRAVAAQQTLAYAQQVFESAQASAELARRMQSVGNFNRLSRVREQVFYADAATHLATAQHQSLASREALVRWLGLDESQAQTLQLPQRLPDLPQQALTPEAVGAMATRARLDIRLAQSALDEAGKAQGLNAVTRLTDIELTARRNTTFDRAAGTRADARGYEIVVRLPLLDVGDMQRDAWNARTLQAAHQLEAGSGLRESYSAYRTAHDIARHHRDEVVPLRKLISDENLLRYNGMIIGVFELLADARDQVSTVMAAIDAEQQFWLADAALQASLIGRPTQAALSVTSGAPATGAAGH